MPVSRICWLLLFGAFLTACSGNLGGGQSTLPGAPLGTNSVQQAPLPAPTASPVSASNVATVGESLDAQPLPAVMGWGGTIAFTKPVPSPSPSLNPKQSASPSSAPDAAVVSIGVTAAVVEPPDAPHFAASAKGKAASKGLFYVSLLSTADLTLAQYPRIAIDVPRDIVAKYRDRPFALAVYDPETKAKAYRLAVAEPDLSSPAPGATLAASATPTPVASANAQMANTSVLTPPPVGSGLGDAALPPERVSFLPAASTLLLRANRPVVFVLYAGAAASPEPSAKPGSSASPAPSVSNSPSPVLPSSSPSAAASPL